MSGESFASNVVIEAAQFTNISATALIKRGTGKLVGIFVASASATPTIKVWDDVAATGTVIVNTFTPTGATFYPIPAAFSNGCFITISGTVDCTAFWSQ